MLQVERAIHTKYNHYQNDVEFLRTRQQHANLRAKLSVLKKRIADWEQQRSTHKQQNDTGNGTIDNNNLMVM